MVVPLGDYNCFFRSRWFPRFFFRVEDIPHFRSQANRNTSFRLQHRNRWKEMAEDPPYEALLTENETTLT
uniref:Uncharacterized protein n=1 Tax=Arundo donax TaxID=35708 RepID=A0A0A9C764_ARUDO